MSYYKFSCQCRNSGSGYHLCNFGQGLLQRLHLCDNIRPPGKERFVIESCLGKAPFLDVCLQKLLVPTEPIDRVV